MKGYNNYINEKKKTKNIETLSKLKDYIIIKDDIGEFYFVNNITKTTCGEKNKMNKNFKDFKTDEDGRILAECINCKTKGLLLDHIDEIIFK